MSLTSFPNGISTSHIVSAETVGNTGRVFFVGNSTVHAPGGIAGADINNGKYGASPNQPFATLDFAIGRTVANRGDTIFVMPNHAETVAAAAGIAVDVAGISIIGLGVGENRPRFTFSAAGSTIAISADDVKFLNCIGLPSVDSVTNAFNVTGNDVQMDIEWIETDDAIEAITVVRLYTADNANLKLRVLGRTGGNAMVRCVAVDDCENVRIQIDGYGLVSTAWVNLVDAASQNIRVDGRLFTQGITSGARDVVDTVGGSTWSGTVFDASAGAVFSGGSASAWATDDITALAAAIDAVDNMLDTEFPVVVTAVGAVADAALADTIEGAAAATQSILTDLKGVLQRVGADNANNTSATTLVADNRDGSLLERTETIIATLRDDVASNFIGVDSANNTAATTLVVANRDASILERLEQLEATVQKTIARVQTTPSGGADTLFTITGGPIHIVSIWGIVTTVLAGVKIETPQATTTDPAATTAMSTTVAIDND